MFVNLNNIYNEYFD